MELIDTPKPVTGKLCIWLHRKIANFFDSISICAIFFLLIEENEMKKADLLNNYLLLLAASH